MKINKFIRVLSAVNWFSKVGEFEEKQGMISIPNLEAWDSSEFRPGLDKKLAKIAAEMDWLPTTRDQIDPIYGDKLKLGLRAIPEGSKQVLMAYKLAMSSLRNIDKRSFISGPNDFTEAAKGAALYAVRMAAIESLMDKPGFWTDIFNCYSKGYWPCGLINSRIVVVY
jgi:hypothetical protein